MSENIDEQDIGQASHRTRSKMDMVKEVKESTTEWIIGSLAQSVSSHTKRAAVLSQYTLSICSDHSLGKPSSSVCCTPLPSEREGLCRMCVHLNTQLSCWCLQLVVSSVGLQVTWAPQHAAR